MRPFQKETPEACCVVSLSLPRPSKFRLTFCFPLVTIVILNYKFNRTGLSGYKTKRVTALYRVDAKGISTPARFSQVEAPLKEPSKEPGAHGGKSWTGSGLIVDVLMGPNPSCDPRKPKKRLFAEPPNHGQYVLYTIPCYRRPKYNMPDYIRPYHSIPHYKAWIQALDSVGLLGEGGASAEAARMAGAVQLAMLVGGPHTCSLVGFARLYTSDISIYTYTYMIYVYVCTYT